MAGTAFHGPLYVKTASGSKVMIADADGGLVYSLPFAITNTLTVGVDDTGHDVLFYGATTGKSFLWDESADKLIITGDQSVSGTLTIIAGGKITTSVANTVVPVLLNQVQAAVSTSTAVALTQYNTTVDSTSGALALTLADSTVTGQKKRVQMIVDNGDATLTFNTNATIVFADVGDTAELIWNGSDWIPVALYNIVDGATAPAYTPAS